MGVTKGLAMQRLMGLMAKTYGAERATFEFVLCIGETDAASPLTPSPAQHPYALATAHQHGHHCLPPLPHLHSPSSSALISLSSSLPQSPPLHTALPSSSLLPPGHLLQRDENMFSLMEGHTIDGTTSNSHPPMHNGYTRAASDFKIAVSGPI